MSWQEFRAGAIRYFTVLGVITAIIVIVALFSLRTKVASKLDEHRAGRSVVGVWEGERESGTLKDIPLIRARWVFTESSFTLNTDYYYEDSGAWQRVHEMQGDYEYIRKGGLRPSKVSLSSVTVRRASSSKSTDPINLRYALRLDPVDDTMDKWNSPRIEYPDLTVRYSKDSKTLSIGTNLIGVASYEKVE